MNRVDARSGAVVKSLVVGLTALAACGETARKHEAGPPLYDSTESFSTGTGGSIGIGGPDHESNNPIYRGSLAQSAVVVGDHLVVIPPPRQFFGLVPRSESAGLLVYALTDPLAPTLVGRLELTGWPLQMMANGSSVTLVLRGPRRVDETAIPDAALSDPSTLLLEIDLSDPTAPRKLAEHEVGDGFWQLSKAEGYDYVLADRSRDVAPCEFNGETSRASYIEAMQVSSFMLGANGFAPIAEVELPFDGYLAFATAKGFVAVNDAYEESPSLSAARFSADGALTLTSPVPAAGFVQAAGEIDDVLAVLTTAADSAATVATFNLASPTELVPIGSVTLPAGYSSFNLKPATIAGEGVLLGDGFVVRLDVSGAPRIVALAPDARLLAAGDHVVSVRPSPSQTLELTLFTLNSGSSASLVASADTAWPYTSSNSGPWSEDPFSWDPSGRLVYLYADAQAPGGGSLGVATVSGTSIDAASTALDAWGRALLAGDTAHVIGELSMQSASVIAMTPGDVMQFYDPEHLIAELTFADRGARLVRRADDVFLSLDGVEFQLPHFADELELTERYLIAAGLRQSPDCERFPELTEAEQLCQKPIARGLTFLALDSAAPEPITLPIDSQMHGLALPADSEHWTSWEGLLEVGSDRLVFPVTRTITCGSAESCAELGMPAFRSFGSPGCAEPPCDPSTQQPFETVSGTGTQSLLYSLDLTQPLSFEAPLILTPSSGRQGRFDFQSAELATSLDLGAEILRAGDRLAFVTRDPVYDDEGNSVAGAGGHGLIRFGLELVDTAGGALVHEASLSTPGRPVALSPDATHVLSVEPRVMDSLHTLGLLHRSAIRGGGVYIEQSVELGEGYDEGLQQGERAFFLTSLDYCALEPTSDLFYADLTNPALATSERLTLPFHWSLERSAETSDPTTLILMGGPIGFRGRADIDVSTDTLNVTRYYSVE